MRLNERFMGNLEALTRRGELLKELVNNSHQLSAYAQKLEQEVSKKNEKMKNSCLFM
jgi:hypothetical protein